MNHHHQHAPRLGLLAVALTIALGSSPSIASAAESCGGFEACDIYLVVDATSGELGIEASVDAGNWKQLRIDDPDGNELFHAHATSHKHGQNLAELNFESSDVLCEEGLSDDPEDPVLTLTDFLDTYPAGAYDFSVKLRDWEKKSRGWVFGSVEMTHVIPPAPTDLAFDGSAISWTLGDDLGVCTTAPPGFELATEDGLAGYEVVVEPGDPDFADFVFTTQVPVGVNSVTVPLEYLAGLPADTPLTIEVAAVERRADGSFGNETESEADGFCSNIDQTLCPVVNPLAAPAVKIAPEPVLIAPKPEFDARPGIIPGGPGRIQ